MTPETDAKASPHIGFFSCATVPAEFARKLERERNEAIRARDVALKAAHTYDEAHTKALEGWVQAERERDEAREIIRKAKVKFCEDGPDGKIAAEMFAILGSLEREYK